MCAMSTHYDYPDASATAIRPFTEDELAVFLAGEGVATTLSKGRYWRRAAPGFWVGLHWLARFRAEEIARPRLACWAYRAGLTDEDAGLANASIPIYLVRDAAAYGEGSLSSRTARYMRAFRKDDIRIVRLTDSLLMDQQGFEVYRSWSLRTKDMVVQESQKDGYLAKMRRRIESPSWMVLAGIRGDTLLGYMASWAVDGAAYLNALHVRSESLDTHLSAALYFESIRAYGASGLVQEVTCGLQEPEHASLGQFKTRVGFELVSIPARFWMHPLAGLVVRRRLPEKYFRLTGEWPEQG
jgi:hypothetical protein